MGARIKLVDRTVLIEGVKEMYGALVTVTDLRAGAALIVAGADGHRGYGNLRNRLH